MPRAESSCQAGFPCSRRAPMFAQAGPFPRSRAADVPCRYFSLGHCQKGRRCRFSHALDGSVHGSDDCAPDSSEEQPTACQPSSTAAQWLATTTNTGVALPPPVSSNIAQPPAPGSPQLRPPIDQPRSHRTRQQEWDALHGSGATPLQTFPFQSRALQPLPYKSTAAYAAAQQRPEAMLRADAARLGLPPAPGRFAAAEECLRLQRLHAAPAAVPAVAVAKGGPGDQLSSATQPTPPPPPPTPPQPQPPPTPQPTPGPAKDAAIAAVVEYLRRRPPNQTTDQTSSSPPHENERPAIYGSWS